LFPPPLLSFPSASANNNNNCDWKDGHPTANDRRCPKTLLLAGIARRHPKAKANTTPIVESKWPSEFANAAIVE
jgi:hypothetical protein